MKVEQHVYLRACSPTVSSDAMAELFGVPHDTSFPTMSKHPPHGYTTRVNFWCLGSGLTPDAGLNEHFEALRLRAGPAALAIRAFSTGQQQPVFISVVRNFTPSPTDAELGFSLSEKFMSFVADLGAEIDFAEYDYSQGLDEA